MSEGDPTVLLNENGKGVISESEVKGAEIQVPELMEMEKGGTLKRKREDDNPIQPEIDDPLLVTKKRARQRTVERVKKVNTVVKKVKKRKKEDEDMKIDENQEPKDPEGKARGYQMEILREAQKRNTIVYLETGCGKTLIAVLLMRSVAHKLRMPERKRIAVFLVPTVNLVRQQSCVIDCHTDLKFGEYVGHMGVDTWKPEKWLEEIASHEVLVMTPQILLDLLTHAILKLDTVELLIFDECHHATKKHPYCKIMDRYRETPAGSRPKIFGMTASPVNNKGVSSGADADKQLAALEQKLDAKVSAVKNRHELEAFVPTPETHGIEYEASTFSTEAYKSKLQEILEKYQVYERIGVAAEQFKDYDEVAKKLRKSINKLHNALLYCLEELGLLCAHKAAEILLKEDVKETLVELNMDVVKVLQSAKYSFLKEALEVFRSAISKETDEDLSELVKEGLMTPKVKMLVDVLMAYRYVDEMRCIVFVDRVVAALVLANLINQFQCLSFLRCEYLAGTSSSLDHISRKFQQSAIENFRAGQLNLLVATNVAEEGLDVQSCHSVIRFDPCKSVRSYIQSRGRARRPGSDYVVFMRKGNEREREDFNKIVQSEIKMTEKAVNRPEGSTISLPTAVVETESFQVKSTGAVMTNDLAVSFMYRFCAKLPGDKFYTPRPEFSFHEEGEGMHVCVLKLPPNSPIQEVAGPARKNQLLAKQVVCLEACRILHATGAISNYLLPVVDEEKTDKADIMNSTKHCGAGTNKQKELHNTIITHTLKGCWGESVSGASLYAYKFIPSCELEDTTYASFVFLVETKVDDDVAELKVQLALRLGRIVTVEVYHAGKVDLNCEQLTNAKEYQELLMNGMFSKLLSRSNKMCGSLSAHKSLSITSNGEMWNNNKMYLLLPLDENNDNNLPEVQINWKAITDTAGAARKFKSIYSGSNANDEEDGLATTSCIEPETLQMAFGVRMKVSDVVDSVVLTIHTGMIYIITNVHNKNAKASFLSECNAEEPAFSDYCAYFAQKHKQLLKHPDQPLLQAKQTHRPRNLLARNSVTGNKKKHKGGNAQEAGLSLVEIPPELCVVLGVSTSVVRSMYLVPSVMHRFEAALTASELRRVIREENLTCPNIPVMRILEALTTLRCLEEFSLEGLEHLGDSFLKYAVSSYLFLEFDNKHEGQLSARRCREICNAKLHSLAMRRRLPEYIRDEVFDPSCWVPPGMLCPKAMLCRCNLANLWQSQVEGVEDQKNDTAMPGPKVVKIGKSCANGHRWLCSKTISDVVEALIGSYFVEAGLAGALSFMTWAGFQVEVEEMKVERARNHSVVDPMVNVGVDLGGLESILNYSFTNKALLVEAITHASHVGPRGGFCYQRLEFLGDAVLDLLITKHLFFSHPGLTPGRLTDLRSAAVNNECFARVAVKHKLNKYLRHGSGFLLKQIEDFVGLYIDSTDKQKNALYGWDGVQGPKVLGDLVESIAGAVLVDTGFKLETVWKVMKPLLSPIVTPETLPLHPVRELQELCHLRDFGLQFDVIQDEKTVMITVDIGVELKLSRTSSQTQTKSAQKDAAQQILLVLESRGIWHPCKVSTLGESSPIMSVPCTLLIDHKSAAATVGNERKCDQLYEQMDLSSDLLDCEETPVDKRVVPSCPRALQEVVAAVAEVYSDSGHDMHMSCGTTNLRTNELESEVLVGVPA